MKKVLIFAITAALLLAFTLPGHSWTGRMAGMGNPYGLVEDESDFLTHPTAITQGKGWQYYGDLGINYNKVSKWDYSNATYNYPVVTGGNGEEWTADGSFGFTFPVNTGRMGFFLGYSGNILSRGKYSGTGAPFGSYDSGTYDLRKDYDAVSAKIIYAQPFTDKVKFGGEFGIAWKSDKNDIYTTGIDYGDGVSIDYIINHPTLTGGANSFYYMLPYDSKYWEANMKASVEGMIGPSKLNFTAFGGFVLSGENKGDFSVFELDGGDYYGVTQKGSVTGWNIGAEAWWRFPVNNNIAIPILLKTRYSEKTWDGNGMSIVGLRQTEYEIREKLFNLEVGGGIDAKFGKGRFAAGLYYGYTNNDSDYASLSARPWRYDDNIDVYTSPKFAEHRITLRLAGAVDLTPAVALNGGLSFFYGWVVNNDFSRYTDRWGDSFNVSQDGHAWGLGLSVGAAIKFNGLVLEPYLKGGYMKLKTSGDGIGFDTYTPDYYFFVPGSDYKKTQWNVGGGFAIKFN